MQNMDIDSSELYKYATLKTERNMKATILAYEKLALERSDKKILFLFENSTKCKYTNEYAKNGEYFFDKSKHEKTNQSSNLEVKNFRHIIKILNQKDTSLSDFYAKINLKKNNSLKILSELSYNDAKFLEESIDVFLCPTKNSTECFARMINGYFVEDLQPHQTYALIKFINSFGYEFIGIGANLLLFYTDKQLRADKANTLYNELAKIYGVSDSNIKDAIGFLIQNKNYLLLPYTNSLSLI